jgi:hypothetical protein
MIKMYIIHEGTGTQSRLQLKILKLSTEKSNSPFSENSDRPITLKPEANPTIVSYDVGTFTKIFATQPTA